MMKKCPTYALAFKAASVSVEGYPFDDLYVNYFCAGMPVWISHYSKGGVWAFVEYADKIAGFVLPMCLSTFSAKDIEKIGTLSVCVWTKDDCPIILCTKVFGTYRILGCQHRWLKKVKMGLSCLLCQSSGYVNWVKVIVPTHVFLMGSVIGIKEGCIGYNDRVYNN